MKYLPSETETETETGGVRLGIGLLVVKTTGEFGGFTAPAPAFGASAQGDDLYGSTPLS